jgi:protein O-mannosyl-transferase
MNPQRSVLHAFGSLRTILVLALAVATITICVHWPCVHNGFLNWDDDVYREVMAQHPQLTWQTVAWAFSTTVPFYYHPLAFLSHVVDYQLWGNQPAGHHLTSLLLHGLNSGLIVLLVWLLLENAGTSTGERLTLAVAVALAFGVHPLQVEPVAWVAERKTVLCAFFSLLCLCAYLRDVRVDASGGCAAPRTHRRWRWATAALFVAALLAKPSAMTLPFVMLAMDFCPLRRHETIGWRRLWQEKILLIGLGAVDLILTVIGQAAVGGVTTLHAQSLQERCLIAARGFIFYLWKLVWPSWLCPFYPLGGDISFHHAEFFLPVLLVILISALSVWLRKRAPGLLAAWCIYLVLLVPVSGLIQVGSQSVADRFAYLPMLAPLLALGWGGVWLWRCVRAPGRIILLALACGELAFFVVSTRQQIPVWHDSETLWRFVLGHFPRSGVAREHLAMALAEQGRFEEALPQAQESLAEIPDYPAARNTLEDVYSKLISARIEQRQFAQARPYARQLLALNATNSSARALLGLIDLKTQRIADSIQELQEALQLNPDLPAARYNLACAYSRAGRYAEACDALQILFSTQPQFAQLAARDSEFSGLRADTAHRERFQALLGGARTP